MFIRALGGQVGRYFIKRMNAVVAAAAALFISLLLPVGAASAVSVISPQGSLTAVSASAANNAWAVGCRPATFQCPGNGADVAYHWNGLAWKQVSVPMPVPPNPLDTESGQLTGVKVISSADAWAVGASSPTGAQLVHWNGTVWKQVAVPKLPAPYGTDYTLSGVGASSATNVWAVGYGGDNESITLHFNGRSWSRVASPSPGSTYLYGVTVTSASSAWAVGSDIGSCACAKALILRWNGKAWKVAVNAFPSPTTILTSVAAVSGSDVWAGGYTRNTVNYTLLMKWNGSSWTRSTSGLGISSLAGFTDVFGVAATSPGNAWAVGSRVLHWNGTTWKPVGTPALPGLGLSSLTSVAATSGANAWAVGSYNDTTDVPHIVILRWNGKAWTRVA
jgi:hypothetical protein